MMELKMKFLTGLLVLIAACIGLAMLIPILTFGLVILCLGGAFLIWALPIIIILSSDETSGVEKICWVLAIVCLSWFAWIFYFFLAPISPKREYLYYD